MATISAKARAKVTAEPMSLPDAPNAKEKAFATTPLCPTINRPLKNVSFARSARAAPESKLVAKETEKEALTDVSNVKAGDSFMSLL